MRLMKLTLTLAALLMSLSLSAQHAVVTTTGGVLLDAASEAQLVRALEDARDELTRLQRLKGRVCPDRAALIGEKVDLKIERALLVLQQVHQQGGASVQVSAGVGGHHGVVAAPGVVVTTHDGQVGVIGHPAPAMAPPVAVVVEEEPMVMAAPDVQRLVAAVAAEAFADDKLGVLELGLRGQYILVSDVRALLDQFSFGDDKLKALRQIAPAIADRDRQFELLEAFSFSDDKKKARAILR
jgi:hypothetical protein